MSADFRSLVKRILVAALKGIVVALVVDLACYLLGLGGANSSTTAAFAALYFDAIRERA